jgi:PAS domain-containing protein
MSSRTSDRMEGQGRVVAESAQDHLGELFRDAPGFIAMLRAPDFTIELANEAYHDLVGRREIIGKPLFDVLRDARDQGFEALLRRVLDSGERFVGREMSVVLD